MQSSASPACPLRHSIPPHRSAERAPVSGATPVDVRQTPLRVEQPFRPPLPAHLSPELEPRAGLDFPSVTGNLQTVVKGLLTLVDRIFARLGWLPFPRPLEFPAANRGSRRVARLATSGALLNGRMDDIRGSGLDVVKPSQE